LRCSGSSSWRRSVVLESSRRDGASPGQGGLSRPLAHEGGSRPPGRKLRLVVELSFLSLLSLLSAAGAAGLDAKPSRSTDGVYQLSWQARGEVVLEEAQNPGFMDSRVVYRGRDQATTLTGRRDGVYYYRLFPLPPATSGRGISPGQGLAAGGEGTSIPVQVRVEHHSLVRALGVFAVGLAVFAATVRLVLKGPEDAAPEQDSRAAPVVKEDA